MVLMLVKPDFYLQSASKGLSLFASSVLPSLFPFYFCSLLLTYTGAAHTISQLGKKPVKLLYNAPKESAYALFLSILCGYPVGASTLCELYEAGAISEEDAKTCSAFCQTAGPVFMLGTVGGAIFQNQKIGLIVLIAHYLGALLNGLLYRSKGKVSQQKYNIVKLSSVDLDSILSKTISKSTINMLCVGGYIVICGMLADTLELVGLTTLIANLGNFSLPIKSVCYGVIEMTRGTIECANIINPRVSIPLCTGIISLGGLSVTLQSYTFLSKCGMSLASIMLRKLTQCLISMPIAFLISFCI